MSGTYSRKMPRAGRWEAASAAPGGPSGEGLDILHRSDFPHIRPKLPAQVAGIIMVGTKLSKRG